MNSQDSAKHNWFVRNLANFITLARLILIILDLYFWKISVEAKIFWYVVFEATDYLDGRVANWLENAKSFGRIFDPAVDKINKVLVLIFLLYNRLLDPTMIGLIMLGEAFVFVIAAYGIYLSLKRQFQKKKKGIRPIDSIRKMINDRRINFKEKMAKLYVFLKDVLSEAVKEVISHWKIDLGGKIAMIFYFAMTAFIFFDFKLSAINLLLAKTSAVSMSKGVIEFLILFSFLGGIISRAVSISKYWRYLDKLTGES